MSETGFIYHPDNKVGDICVLESGKLAKIVKIGTEQEVDELWLGEGDDPLQTPYVDYVVETIEAYPESVIVKSYDFIEAEASEIAKARLLNR